MVRIVIAVLALAAMAQRGQSQSPVVLQVDVDNAVQYRSDIADPARRGTDAALTNAAPPRAFTDVLIIGDIVAVNGRPARGLWTSRQLLMNFSPTPAAGFAIADVTRGTTADCKWEFLDGDGKFIGALMDSGYAPHAVSGGLGAYFGVRGQMAGGTHPSPRPIRVASMSEDPSNRRINGGGNSRIIFHLIPLYRPEVVAAYHADFSPVTPGNPAVADEIIILRAGGLGPVEPGTTPPGVQPFSAEPLQQIHAPVEVTVDGQVAPVLNKIGWPGTLDNYRIDIRVPRGVSAGRAPVQVSAAWIPGVPFALPVR